MRTWPLVSALVLTGLTAFAAEPSAVLTDFGQVPAARSQAPQTPQTPARPGSSSMSPEARKARASGVSWLLQHQHGDGGWASGDWGTSGTEATSDVATTAFAVLALHRDAAGSSRNAAELRRGVEFVVHAVERAPEGPRLATPENTQIQTKLGALVDTHLAALMLGEVAPSLQGDLSLRARRALEQCVRKVERAQNADGSFDSNGWASVLSTAVAAQGLNQAAALGVDIDDEVLARSDRYQAALAPAPQSVDTSAGAGVQLYAVASALRGSADTRDRRGTDAPSAAAKSSAEQTQQVASGLVASGGEQLIAGFGSVGGEEMLSYMMISDTLAEKGGREWTDWEAKIGAFLASAQNADGSWVGHHCITSEAFATAGGVLTLSAGDHARREG
jgi:hypothetical protein